MRVLFRIRSQKASKATQVFIYCRIKVDGIHANDFSTFIKINREQWDSKSQRVIGKSMDVANHNLRLEQIRNDINRLFLQHQAVDQELTAQHLANIYTGKAKISYTLSELVDLFEQHIKASYDNKGTRRNYGTRIGNIRSFISEKKLTNLPAERINLGLADDFVRWMKAKQRDHNYIVRHTQILKNITEDAVRREILKIDPLASFKLKKRQKTNTAHLTLAQLAELESIRFRPVMQEYVDLFLFSCYTGLHYKDAQTLTEQEIRPGPDGRLWMYKPRGKYAESKFFNEEMIQIVPLHKKALAIIEKYGGVSKLPKRSNAKFNSQLKQIVFENEISFPLTVMIARKTFTDIMLNELNVTENTVAAMLGHCSTRHVHHYGKADQRRVANEMKQKNIDW